MEGSNSAALAVIQAELRGRWRHYEAYNRFKSTVRALGKGKSVLEIGAGRAPMFSPEEIRTDAIDYSANDINQDELDAMPVPLPSRAFDASTIVPPEWQSRFDLIFSRSVQEHVTDTRAFYRNLSSMLKPAGVALNLHPVLYSLPFLINRYVPETVTEPLLYWLRKDRTADASPKFPARYDQCRISQSVRETLRAQGFSEVHQVAFYGHGYYKFLKLAHAAQRGYAGLLHRLNATPLATFAYTIALK